jgi:hypothetical protein
VTDDSKEQFLGERVRALATIVLTRRGDLSIVETRKEETDLDYLVYIDREDKPMRLMFGVLLKGVTSSVTIETANKLLGPTMGQFQGMRKFTYPVCLFFFTMREEQAFFSWLAAPLVSDGVPKLAHLARANCFELTHSRLDQVIEEIVAWYDAVEAVLIA